MLFIFRNYFNALQDLSSMMPSKLPPDTSSEDHNDEQKEASEHICNIKNSEENVKRERLLTGTFEVFVNNPVDALKGPWNSKHNKKLGEENLNIRERRLVTRLGCFYVTAILS